MYFGMLFLLILMVENIIIFLMLGIFYVVGFFKFIVMMIGVVYVILRFLCRNKVKEI